MKVRLYCFLTLYSEICGSGKCIRERKLDVGGVATKKYKQEVTEGKVEDEKVE
jgi:hypothetical protein